MERVKLGELVVDRKVWVRNEIDTDHVRCRVNDLVNGAVFPPLKVDRRTKIIIGGNHRYLAYKTFYGDGWEGQEVDVEYFDLPPFEENRIAWWRMGLEDNRHLAARLRYGDRNSVAANLLKTIDDPESDEAKEMARILHFTPQGWKEFSNVVLDSFESVRKMAEKTAGKQAGQTKTAKTMSAKTVSYAKYSTDDIQPVDVRNLTTSFNSQVLSRANGLITILKETDPDYLSDRSRETLVELSEVLDGVLANKAV